MKLTPKGKRFGDIVRRELSDPNSTLSKITCKFKALKQLAKNHPDEYKFSLNAGFILFSLNTGFILIGTSDKWTEWNMITPIPDMTKWYKHDPIRCMSFCERKPILRRESFGVGKVLVN